MIASALTTQQTGRTKPVRSLSTLFAGVVGACLIAGSLFAGQAQADSGAYANGTVRAIAYDGNGGFFVGGDFTQLNGSVNQSYIAHVNSNSTIDSAFKPTLNGSVRALAYSSGKLYVGGSFTTINSTTRNRIAAINTADGSLDTTFNPGAGGTVNAVVLSGSNVYIGGSFSTLGGSTRNNIGVVTTSGTLGSWNPNVNGAVNAIAVTTNVYFGGSFSTVGGTARANAASMSTGGTLQSNWSPNPNGAVNAIDFNGSNYYIGGDFTSVTINGTTTTRNYAAGITATGTTGGTLLTWNPNIGITGGSTPSVKTLDINATATVGTGTEAVIFIGGLFGTFKGGTSLRDNLAAVTLASTGTVTDLNAGASGSYKNPNPNGTVQAVVAVPGIGLASGVDFTVSALVPQNYYAGPSANAANLVTGTGNTPVDPAVMITKGEQVKGVGYGFYDAGGNQTSLYKWQRCTSLNNLATCSDMNSGEKATTGAWYGLTNNDVGYQTRLKVYWNSINGVITTFSGLTGVVGVIASVPPEMDATFCSFGPADCADTSYDAPHVGEQVKPVIRTSQGKWQGYVAGVSTLTAQWQRCSDVSNPEDPSSCTNIDEADGGTSYWYLPRAADVGYGLRAVITLTTRGQSDSQGSLITNVTVVS